MVKKAQKSKWKDRLRVQIVGNEYQLLVRFALIVMQTKLKM